MNSANYIWPSLYLMVNCVLKYFIVEHFQFLSLWWETMFSPIKWYNCLKYKIYNQFIYQIFSSWRGPLWCGLFAGDSVDKAVNSHVYSCMGLGLPFWGAVEALYSWQMRVSGWETKNIHNWGMWIHFCDF